MEDGEAGKVKAVTKLLYESEKRRAPREGDAASMAQSLQRTSDLLAKVQSFLPKIAKANEAMAGSAEKDETEDSEENDEPYVEMNVAVAPAEVASRLEDAICRAAGGAGDDEEGDGEGDRPKAEARAAAAEDDEVGGSGAGTNDRSAERGEGDLEANKKKKRRKLIEEL